MILVTVGTTPFESLIRAMDAIAPLVGESVLCQIADGKYIPVSCEYFRFKPSLEEDYKNSSLVVCHGGAGTLFGLLRLHKKIISVPNLERRDKHQTDLTDTLTARGLILSCYNLGDLLERIEYLRSTDLAPYESPTCTIAAEILEFIGG